MSNADMVSMVLAGLALVLAVFVAFQIYLSPQHKGRFSRRASPIMEPVSVRLVPSPRTGLGYWWRFQTASDAPPTSVDIFSFKSHGAGTTTPWQHELMESPLTLEPAEAAYLRAPALATAGSAYDVSVGWTIHRSTGADQGSVVATIKPEPLV